MNSERVSKFKEYLASPEGIASTKKYFADLEAKSADEKAFFQTERFNELFAMIKEYCEQGGSINCESLAYKTHSLSDKLSADELWLVQSAISKNGYPVRNNNDADWPTSGVVYDGILFEMVSGQGTILCVDKAPADCYANKTHKLTEEVVFVGSDCGLEAMYHNGKRVELESDYVTDILSALGISCKIISLDRDELTDDLNDIQGITWNTDTQ